VKEDASGGGVSPIGDWGRHRPMGGEISTASSTEGAEATHGGRATPKA